jgi:hypothetical protein
MCWLFHKWSKWETKTYTMWSITAQRRYVEVRQSRTCERCGLTVERTI